jgi:hypothetical protein
MNAKKVRGDINNKRMGKIKQNANNIIIRTTAHVGKGVGCG